MDGGKLQGKYKQINIRFNQSDGDGAARDKKREKTKEEVEEDM